MTHAHANERRPPRPARRALPEEPLWYRDAIFYEVRVRAFYDSDGDGIGDFKGLAEKLDYLHDLGVTTLWLLPFYPSPLKDDGYDISDFTSVHPDCGTLEHFKHFLREAHRRGLRVVTELVINHTSDQHPWFQRARRSALGSRWREYYVWSDTPDRYREARIIFKDFERSNWTWDDVAGAYYWHRFYSHQPDLNFEHPDVRKAVFRVLDFWLNLGVDGLRLDAIPYLYEREGTNCENLPETHAFLRALRAHVDRNYADRMLLAEANQWPEDAVAYFGEGDECHMAFHFPVMPRLFMALHMEDRFPIIDILQQTPDVPDACQWALFLRNHDELTLEMVTDEERDYMYRVYAHDTQARINLGIRRRLAPLLGNDRRRMELMNALLFSLPGTPVLYYGDEIGMGDNIYLGDRNGVRTPMQWSGDRNAGFSRANPQRLYLPVIVDPEYHYESHNVEAQQNNLHSMLFWMKRLIALRKGHKAFGRGSISFLTPSNRKVLAFVRHHEDETLLVVANLSRFVEYVELDLSAWKGMVAVELFGKKPFPPIGDLPYLLTLGPHSFYWFSLEQPKRGTAAQVAAGEAPLPVLHAKGSWLNALRGDAQPALSAALAQTLRRRGWLTGTAASTARVGLVDAVELSDAEQEARILIASAEAAGHSELFALSVTFAEGEKAVRMRDQHRDAVIAEIEVAGKGTTTRGVLYDALEDPEIALGLLDAIARRRTLRGELGEIVPSHTRAFRSLRGPGDADVTPSLMRPEPYQQAVVYGNRLVLKVLRGVTEGINAELEMGLFLTERVSFVHAAPIAGALEYRRPRREPATIAILQGYVPNEGDAFRFTVDQVQHYFQRALARSAEIGEVPTPREGPVALTDREPPPLVGEMMGGYLEFARLLGRRTAELHLALSQDPDDPAFAPEPYTMLAQRSLYQSLRNQALFVLAQLRERMATLPDEVAELARAVVAQEQEVVQRFASALLGRRIVATRIRNHGDYELRQVLYTGRDFVVVDLAASDIQTPAERRIKTSPLRDVASMLWSFHHAARGGLLGDGSAALVRPEDVPILEPWGHFFARWAGSNFLRGYLQQAGEASFVPRERRDLAGLLLVFALEKSFDEIHQEIDRRPGWLRIPLRGILELLGIEHAP
ncbi:MAG: maltose alpha-D-glucosyltransferase [Thermodesulfobacteriota bacterium]